MFDRLNARSRVIHRTNKWNFRGTKKEEGSSRLHYTVTDFQGGKLRGNCETREVLDIFQRRILQGERERERSYRLVFPPLPLLFSCRARSSRDRWKEIHGERRNIEFQVRWVPSTGYLTSLSYFLRTYVPRRSPSRYFFSQVTNDGIFQLIPSEFQPR